MSEAYSSFLFALIEDVGRVGDNGEAATQLAQYAPFLELSESAFSQAAQPRTTRSVAGLEFESTSTVVSVRSFHKRPDTSCGAI